MPDPNATQDCGHPLNHCYPHPAGGTFCQTCFPDGPLTTEEYVRRNVFKFADITSPFAVAGLTRRIVIAGAPSLSLAAQSADLFDLALESPAWVFNVETQETAYRNEPAVALFAKEEGKLP